MARAKEYRLTLEELTEIEFSVSDESGREYFLRHETVQENYENASHYRLSVLELDALKSEIIKEHFVQRERA